MTKGAAALGQALPKDFGGNAISGIALRRMGMPAIAGGSEDEVAAAIPREALTPDHPIVQAVAKASEVNGAPVDPAAVSKLIQSPGFNPINLAKAGSRRNPVQTAALTAYRVASDAELSNGLVKAAQEATGAVEPTVDQQWDTVLGLGGRLDQAAGQSPITELSPAEQQAVYRTKLRQTQGPTSPFEAAAPGEGELSDLMSKQGRAPVDPGDAEAAMGRYRDALNEWQTTGNVPEGYQLNGDMQSARGLSPTDPDEQVALAAATKRTSGTMTREEAEGGLLPKQSTGTFGDAWRATNRGIVQAKLMNPLIHTWNLLSETLNQYADPRQLAGIVGDFKAGEAAMRNPDIAAQLVDESNGRLNLPTQRAYADDIGGAVKGGMNNVPVVGGVKNAYDAVTAFNHKMLFENLGQRLQIASYQGAKRMGMDSETAAAYANAKFGQIGNADRNDLMQWVGNNVAFAGKWVQGTGIQLGSLVGKPGFGGYASTLTDAQKTQLASGLRGDFLKGIGLLVGSHAIINHHLSGQWPWQNEDGRWLDINTGQQTADGKTIYAPDPFFRRVQDALHLLAAPIPGNPAMRAMGTTTTSALANKAAPLLGAAADIASGSQYLSPTDQPPGVTGGPPIIAPGTTDTGDLAKQMGAFAFNQVSPVQAKYGAGARSPEGIKLATPTLNFDVGPNPSKAG
ncbi:MAG: hypothetical protein ACHQ7M_15335, partial [Chloroflexota bacterium]